MLFIDPTNYFNEAEDLGVSKEKIWRYIDLQTSRENEHQMDLIRKENKPNKQKLGKHDRSIMAKGA